MVATRPDPAADTSEKGLSEAAEAEWQRLRKQIDFAVEFWLAFAFLPSPHDARIMRERASAMLAERGRSMLVVSPKTPDELRNDVLPMLFGEEAGAAGCVWIEAVERDPYGKVSSPWGTAWTWLAMRMNERRDALRRHIQGGLVLVGPPEIKPHVRDSASDLWSVRSIVVEVAERPKPDPDVVIAPTHEESIKIVTASPQMRSILQLADINARSKLPILLEGEPGTGKNLLAHWIHEHSPRRNHPMVVVDCAVTPEFLIPSELFGQERGAFTGASARAGAFERAHRGTLLVAEVTDLLLDSQARLLRALETKSFNRIGATTARHADVRIIATARHNLREACEAGNFRTDLYYRLAGDVLTLSPLRERREDIRLLAEHFLERTAKANSLHIDNIDRDALALLEGYSWPGNVRELLHAIDHAAMICKGSSITVDDLPDGIRSYASGTSITPVAPGSTLPDDDEQWTGGLKARLHRYEAEILVEALEKTRWNIAEAARLLDISRSALFYKIRAHGIRRPDE